MKAIIDFDSYDSQLNPIIYTFNTWLIGASIIGASLYTLIFDILASRDGSINSEVFANLFFRGMLSWAAVYMLKKIWLNKTIKRAFDTQGVPESYYFLPCFYNTGIYNTTFGNIIIEDNKLYFQSNRVSKDPILFKSNLDDVKITTDYESKNILCRIFWGDPQILVITDTSNHTSAKFLAPDPKASKAALDAIIHQA